MIVNRNEVHMILWHNNQELSDHWEGNAEYGQLVQQPLFGADSEIVSSKRARTARPGRNRLIAHCAEFLARQQLSRKVWISNPTWVNHFQVSGAAGMETAEYTYYSPATRGLDFAGMLRAKRVFLAYTALKSLLKIQEEFHWYVHDYDRFE